MDQHRRTVSLPIALPVLGTDRNGFNHWHRTHGVFRTKFSEPEPGSARRLSRANCLEIAFFLALFKAMEGRHPAAIAAAIGRATSWLDREKKGTLGAFWAMDLDRKLPNDGFLTGSESLSALASMQAPPVNLPASPGAPAAARSLVIINVGEIVRQIDALFEGEA